MVPSRLLVDSQEALTCRPWVAIQCSWIHEITLKILSLYPLKVSKYERSLGLDDHVRSLKRCVNLGATVQSPKRIPGENLKLVEPYCSYVSKEWCLYTHVWRCMWNTCVYDMHAYNLYDKITAIVWSWWQWQWLSQYTFYRYHASCVF